MTSSNGNIFRVTWPLYGEFTGEFPSQRPVTRNFDVCFDLRLSKRLCKQSRGWWFETLSHSLWRHCNDLVFPQQESGRSVSTGDHCRDNGYHIIHHSDVIMGAIASHITGLTIVYSTIYPSADQRKHQSSASLTFVRGIHRWPAQMSNNAENVTIWSRHHALSGVSRYNLLSDRLPTSKIYLYSICKQISMTRNKNMAPIK